MRFAQRERERERGAEEMVRGEEAREVNGDSLKVVRYGIVGCGMMGQEHMMNLFHLAGAQVVAIADTSRVSLTQACALSTRSGHSRNLEVISRR